MDGRFSCSSVTLLSCNWKVLGQGEDDDDGDEDDDLYDDLDGAEGDGRDSTAVGSVKRSRDHEEEDDEDEEQEQDAKKLKV